MPRKRPADAPRVVHRSARVALRATPAQGRRLWRLLVSGGDVWACVLELNALRRSRGDAPVVGYQALCRELARAGPGTFGELDSVGARSVLRRYSDAWFAAAKARRAGDETARFPRRRRRLVPLRWYLGTFSVQGCSLRIPTAAGRPPLGVRLAREVPYPPDRIRSVTLVAEAGRLYVDVCAELYVAAYDPGQGPDPARLAGVDLGVIHPFAVAGPGGEGLVVSGRAMRAESRLHLAERKARRRAAARRAPLKGQRGSRRWRRFRARDRRIEARHRRRLSQARHEAAKALVSWAVDKRVGRLVVGDPVGTLERDAGRRHSQRLRDWRPGAWKACLSDKAEAAGIEVVFVDERGSSSTCPNCRRRVPKPSGRRFACPHCGLVGHRDVVGAVNIAARHEGGGDIVSMPETITHRRGGRHLPGAGRSRRDPRRIRWDSRRVRRGSWPAVARPPEEPSEGSSSSVGALPLEDPPTAA